MDYDFVNVYSGFTGCNDESNVVHLKEWHGSEDPSVDIFDVDRISVVFTSDVSFGAEGFSMSISLVPREIGMNICQKD